MTIEEVDNKLATGKFEAKLLDGTKIVVLDRKSAEVSYRLVKRGRPKILSTTVDCVTL